MQKVAESGELDVDPNFADRWTIDDVATFESEAGLKIGREGREFLTDFGCVAIEENCHFLAKIPGEPQQVHEVQVLGGSPDQLIANERIFRGRGSHALKYRMFFFGSADGGYRYILLGEENDDAVYIWSGLSGPNEPDELHQPVKISENLADFLNNLQPYENL
ncbi:hypothetical protein [Paracoccus tegillarcae]|uniref:SMI1/KNR4 family protein n=1 Tax=Paracoccus tegillarcae TaxID=1529068 RepID=A0A2K9EDR7_9RHOB|nr:hypothetical protein [Paracoccus tegillarcae]AUH33093.1 hypothetical protein CUV01_06540 [Paracoccus tegillarcae]